MSKFEINIETISAKNFLHEHGQGALWILEQHLKPSKKQNKEVLKIFSKMSKDQLYAVSVLIHQITKK